MNIVCDKTLLSAAIDGVSKAVTMRSAIPVLEGILLKAEGFQLTLTGYDLEMGIVTTIEANVKETDVRHFRPGSDTAPAKSGKTRIGEGDGAVEFPGFLVGTDRGKRIEDIAFSSYDFTFLVKLIRETNTVDCVMDCRC